MRLQRTIFQPPGASVTVDCGAGSVKLYMGLENAGFSAPSLCFDLSTLPARHVDRRGRGPGCALMLFAAVWGGVPTLVLVLHVLQGKWQPALGFLGVFTAAGLALFLTGLAMAGREVETTITAEDVHVRRRLFFRQEEWRAPLAEYKGVLARTEYHPGGKNRSSYTLYIVELLHENPRRVVRLYESSSEKGFRTAWESCARRLKLPALRVGEGDRIEARAPEELDRAARDLVREGKIKVEFDQLHPPAGIGVRAGGDVLELTALGPGSRAGAYVLGVAGLALALAGFAVRSLPLPVKGVGVLFLGLAVAAGVWATVAREQLLLARDRVTARFWTPWGVVGERSLGAEEIEEVRVGRPRDGAPFCLIVESDRATLTFGSGLPRDRLSWIRDCVLYVLAS